MISSMPANFSGRLLIVLYAVHSSPALLASADKPFSMADVHPSAVPAILNSAHHGHSSERCTEKMPAEVKGSLLAD